MTITLEIEKGWSVFANPIENERFVSWQTVVSLKPTMKPTSLKIEYPRGKVYTDPLAPETNCRYYDGEIEIKAFLQRSPGDKGPIEVEVVFVARGETAPGQTTFLFPRQLKVKVP